LNVSNRGDQLGFCFFSQIIGTSNPSRYSKDARNLRPCGSSRETTSKCIEVTTVSAFLSAESIVERLQCSDDFVVKFAE
jgi:hypothetical protein